MKRLYILRHAKSDWSQPGLIDHDRPLNARGARATRIMRSYVSANAIAPDLVLCSTANRTRQTLDGILQPLIDAGQISPKITYSERLYHADSHSLLLQLRAVESDVQSVMLIGHNPGLHDLAAMLAHKGSPDQLVKLRRKFPTGALAILDMQDCLPQHIMSGVARLIDFATPRGLRPKSKATDSRPDGD